MLPKNELQILQAIKSIVETSQKAWIEHQEVAKYLSIEPYRVARFFDVLADKGYLEKDRQIKDNLDPTKFQIYTIVLSNTGKTLLEHPEDLQTGILLRREGIFFDGQQFDAVQFLNEIFSEAESKVVIIDSYSDEAILKILAGKQPTVEINILTKTVSPKFLHEAQLFNQQYTNLFIRQTGVFHDRFLIIDDIDFYHLGSSINHLGKRVFMFSRIEEPEVVGLLRNKWMEEWNKATVVI